MVNTHFHWDHVWGNCAFAAEVIGHEQCRTLLEENWEAQLDKQKKFLRGRVERRLPTITFEQRLCFPEERIELFYSLGHTRDSISLYDQEERILYVGDNLDSLWFMWKIQTSRLISKPWRPMKPTGQS